jgi:diketogulonate reductase-like aldo/keto reductase
MILPKIGQGTGHKGVDLEKYEIDTKNEILNIRLAAELGLTLIDTAEVYADGRSEIIVGKAIKPIRDKVLIASKFSPNNHKFEKVNEAAENSLKRLDIEYLDLYQIHWPNSSIPLHETLGAMWELQKRGMLRKVGLCNFNLNQLQEACELAKQSNNAIYSLQIKFNLIDQFAYRQIRDLCAKNNIKILAYSPIKNLLNVEQDFLRNLNEIALTVNATPIQLAISWITSHENVTAIPESSKKDNLIEISGSKDLFLPAKVKIEVEKLYSNRLVETKVSKIISRNEKREVLAGKRTKSEIAKFSDDFCPSIIELAAEIQEGGFLQPILIKKLSNSLDKFEIAEGELRFWSFVYQFGSDCKIPSIIL